MSVALAKRDLIEPDFWTCPHGVRVRPSLTYGPAVADLCSQAGYAPDPQQELGLDLVFAIRADGSPSCFAFCIICARQNLKSGLFQQCVIGWLFVVEVSEVAWSAHELRTSLLAQVELYRTLESPALSKYLISTGNRGLYDTNGKERIELATGQTVWFQTRTRDGGRGLGKPKVIIDEAFKLKARTAGALLPIMLAQHHPQLLYGSSEPPADDPDAEVLRDVMDRGQHHRSTELSLIQWRAKREPCADPDCTHPKDAVDRGLDCALDREHLLLQANPTVDRDDEGHALETGRITMRTLRNLRQELPPREYMRECMGWPELQGDGLGPPALNARKWHDLRAKSAPAPKRAAVVVDVEPDGSAATVGVAGEGPAGRVMLMQTHKPGTAWVVDQVKTLRTNIEVLEVALHPSTQAGRLGAKLTAAKIDWHPLVHKDLAQGCSAMVAGINEVSAFVHVDQEALTTAVGVVRTKTLATEAMLWDRAATPNVPIGPVVATSTAAHRWAVLTAKPKTPPPPPRRVTSEQTAKSRASSIANVGF